MLLHIVGTVGLEPGELIQTILPRTFQFPFSQIKVMNQPVRPG
jgi:hypothetical protein